MVVSEFIFYIPLTYQQKAAQDKGYSVLEGGGSASSERQKEKPNESLTDVVITLTDRNTEIEKYRNTDEGHAEARRSAGDSS